MKNFSNFFLFCIFIQGCGKDIFSPTNTDSLLAFQEDYLVNDQKNNVDSKYEKSVKKILEKERTLLDNNKFPEFVVRGPVRGNNAIKIGDKTIDHRDWMMEIDGGKKLNQINIPGSHDSLSYSMSKAVKSYSQCQNDSVREQLENGIRIFDIRLFFKKQTYDIYCCHGKGAYRCNCHKKNSDELVSYDFVLSTILCFLKEHPSETVIIAPKHESGDKDLTLFCINLRHERLKKMGVIYMDDRVPSLNEVRGKVVLWDKKGTLAHGMKIILEPKKDFSRGKQYAGVNWKKIQKKFHVNNPQEKIGIVRSSLKEAENVFKNSQGEDYGFIHYTSGFSTELGLPNPKKVADQMNPFIKNYKLQSGCLYGWFMSDFVDANLAKKIFLSNFLQECNYEKK